MQKASKTGDDLHKELEFYKNKVTELSGESIRSDYLLSSLRYELKQRQDGFSLLTQLQEKFSINTSVEELFSESLKAINTHLGMDRTVMLTPDTNANNFSTCFYQGYPASQVSTIKKASLHLPATALRQNSFLLINNSIEADALAKEIREQFLVNFYIGVPVFNDENLIAFLIAGRLYEKIPFNHPLNKGDVDTLIAIASLIRSVFQNKNVAELRHQMKKQKDENELVNRTLAELKATQAHLIQSEKMASLGELAAGIAHEIQNPLNFVNNFSEVNNELLVQLKEQLEKTSHADLALIADDLIENEKKIIYHGKRADSIVKSMLQHSRKNSGKKELTDINTLADEYLRLAYHGMRAKDKFFNAELITDFDESIGNLKVIPQELGRVVLNLLNNAFQAVLVRSKNKNEPGYTPRVSIVTKKTANQVNIRVSDNGTGIPEKIVGKIFQPFFTTKAPGQGTGLGLSLSYDIVKAHGGEIKVETVQGQGSAFIISLPA